MVSTVVATSTKVRRLTTFRVPPEALPRAPGGIWINTFTTPAYPHPEYSMGFKIKGWADVFTLFPRAPLFSDVSPFEFIGYFERDPGASCMIMDMIPARPGHRIVLFAITEVISRNAQSVVDMTLTADSTVRIEHGYSTGNDDSYLYRKEVVDKPGTPGTTVVPVPSPPALDFSASPLVGGPDLPLSYAETYITSDTSVALPAGRRYRVFHTAIYLPVECEIEATTFMPPLETPA